MDRRNAPGLRAQARPPANAPWRSCDRSGETPSRLRRIEPITFILRERDRCAMRTGTVRTRARKNRIGRWRTGTAPAGGQLRSARGWPHHIGALRHSCNIVASGSTPMPMQAGPMQAGPMQTGPMQTGMRADESGAAKVIQGSLATFRVTTIRQMAGSARSRPGSDRGTPDGPSASRSFRSGSAASGSCRFACRTGRLI